MELLADRGELLVDLVEDLAVVDELGVALDLHRELALRVVDAHRHARVALQVLARLAAEHVGEVEVLVVEQGAAALDGDVGHAVGPDRRDPHVVAAGEQIVELLRDPGHDAPSVGSLRVRLTVPGVPVGANGEACGPTERAGARSGRNRLAVPETVSQAPSRGPLEGTRAGRTFSRELVMRTKRASCQPIAALLEPQCRLTPDISGAEQREVKLRCLLTYRSYSTAAYHETDEVDQ